MDHLFQLCYLGMYFNKIQLPEVSKVLLNSLANMMINTTACLWKKKKEKKEISISAQNSLL